MLKNRIVILDENKKKQLCSEELLYEKIKIIGQGTFGKVYLAKNKKDGTLYALKQVLQDKRYKNRQLSIIARLQHCNIINMKQYFLKVIKEECFLTIIMDFIPSSLNLLIKQQRKIKKPFPVVVRKILLFQFFKALYYLEQTKVCHRDLKPPNILVNEITYELKICDFGSAKILQKIESNVSYICSRYYRAPELVMQATDYRTQIDMWSAGCIAVELLTLQPIFPGDSSQEQLIEIIKILGTPPQKYLRLYQQQKGTMYNFPQIKPNSWQQILYKYEPQRQLIDLISKMLTYDTKNRLKPLEGLRHSYFEDLHKYTTQISKLPNLFYFGDLQNKSNTKIIQKLQKLYPNIEPQLKEKNMSTSIQQIVKNQKTPITCNQ